jgi:cytochrome c oxidase accessory protein FixG
LATYGNAGWLREQVCKYMCPYARFQSAMFDRDTLIITYDKARGEPRGALNKTKAAQAQGECIDCTLCVQVCPTGIDIRNGLQYECIGCTACVDACDSVMDKVGQPRGLIRYSTDRAIATGMSARAILRRAFRPRVLIYSAILWCLVAVVGTALYVRNPLKLDVLRDRGSMGRELDGGTIENVYRLQIMNTSEVPRKLRLHVEGLPGLRVAGSEEVTIAPLYTLSLPVRLQLDHGKGHPGTNKIRIGLEGIDAPAAVTEDAVFLVPR